MAKKNRKLFSSSSALPLPLPVLRLGLFPFLFMMLAILGIFLHRINVAPVEQARVFFTDLLTPVFSAVSEPVKTAVNHVDAVTGIRDLRVENIRLTEENLRLQQWYDTALRLEAENRGLKSLLSFKAAPAYKYISTRVVADPGGSFIKSLLLPIGANDGVRKGQAVMAEKAMIGRIIEVGKTASRVLMVTDLNAHIPILVEGTRQKAILAGQNQDTMYLKHLPLDSKPALGARIVTSGDGGLLPPNLPLGTIISNKDGQMQVQPIDDLSKLEYVRVIDFSIDDALISGDIE